MQAELHVNVERKAFLLDDHSIEVLEDNSFGIHEGEFVALLGPSGCGKTTLLRLLLGLDLDYEGELRLLGKPIGGPGLDRGAVFQEPRLMPWLTVRQNVAFAVQRSLQPKGSLERVDQLLELVGLTDFKTAWPNQLSGGMAQRVALARAFVNLPELLLLDEPFGSLDSITRMRLQDELLKILDQEQTTALLVTHDFDEAVYLSDRILVMTPRPGRIVAEMPVRLPRPRERTATEFLELRSELMNRFYEAIQSVA